MTEAVLLALAVIVPGVAVVLEHVGDARISERHHSHHDTYVVPVSLPRSIVTAMVFMGLLGVVVGGLALLGLVATRPVVVLGFVDAFLVTCLAMWLGLCRYRVSVFGDGMVVTPIVGRRRWIAFDKIERLTWSGLRMESGFRSLVVWVDGRHAATLLGLVDLEQIIMGMDRYDLLSLKS